MLHQCNPSEVHDIKRKGLGQYFSLRFSLLHLKEKPPILANGNLSHLRIPLLVLSKITKCFF